MIEGPDSKRCIRFGVKFLSWFLEIWLTVPSSYYQSVSTAFADFAEARRAANLILITEYVSATKRVFAKCSETRRIVAEGV